ncbi:SusD/RagB family nutrient-binding outer membrane lipoprotein [Prolixibacter denitrificans]|uniref:SusD-like starch-binding protein associating with outer membrane n=1 Tax=Prolixibacter denitrificans TaxID=1541063 RepID=A0A2P8CBQ4_9BACT|nr:SusD/RagB family nutrient-binding outer membrane lipoprotein [Prolixibacter denitrificans]PSK82384.1 SusD-like starch-binding protein associating with outer membrane [Prolixibacter denitrificans]GET22870.1 hypothetical protein JCM18694_31160 [Prolixibacter denitrificans]
MKKIIYLLAVVLLSGCSNWLDVNTNPNTPSDVPVNLVLPSAEASVAVTVGGNMFNYGGFFAQYWGQAPEANQYNAIDEYDIKNVFFDDDYQELYAGALVDLKSVRDKAKENGDWGDYFAATVLRAYTFQVIADLTDKTPYSEALGGSELANPKYDDGQAIYEGVISELNNAMDSLTANSTVTDNDMIFGGSLQQWIGFANAMKLKLYMRESYATDAHKADVQKLISDNNFFTGDVTFDNFSDAPNKQNPWYATNISSDGLGTVNNIATYNIVTYLKANNDPRLPVLYQKAPNPDDYAGNMPGYKSRSGAKNNDFSRPIVDPTQPVYMYTQSELQLFIAEAELRYNNDDAAAKAAYEKAIDANLALHGLSTPGSDLYGTGQPYAWNSSATSEQKLKTIMMQKWVCLCMVNHIEAWSEIRRTHYPELSPAEGKDIADDPTLYTPGDMIDPVVNVLGKGQLIKRLPFSERAIIRNTNAPEQVGVTTKVWWDKK